MILTGKAADSFLNYLLESNQQVNINYEYQDELIRFDLRIKPDDDYVLLLSKIIDWLDSVGIYIHVDNLTNVIMSNGEHAWRSYIKRKFKNRKKCSEWCDTRQQATEEAIKQANEIYNLRK